MGSSLIINNKEVIQAFYNNKEITEIYKGNIQIWASFEETPIRFDAMETFQEYIVPSGCTKLSIDCVAPKGHDGNMSGGNGGRVQCTLQVSSRQKLYIYVGNQPNTYTTRFYNASDIRTNNTGITDVTSLQSRLIVAGGGGNGGVSQNLKGNGGAGGGLTGAKGEDTTRCVGGYGGTQTAGGSSSQSAGELGLGGNTWDSGWSMYGGAGGAGWYGGGAGNTNHQSGHGYYAAGGGGGSSYTHPDLCTDVIHTQGYNAGNGYIIITPKKK